MRLRLPTLFGFFDAAAFVGGLLVIAAAFGKMHWRCELWANFLPQFFFCFAGYCVLALLRRRWKSALLALIFTFWCTLLCNRSSFIANKAQGRGIKILQANVLTGNRDATKLLDLIAKEQPDVILLQETDLDWMRRLEPLSENYPVSASDPRGDNYGAAVFARKGATAAIGHFGVEARFRNVTFFGLHPAAPLSADGWRDRNTFLQEAAAEFKGKDLTLVCGDFNASATSPTFRAFLQESGLRDCDRSFFATPTWHAHFPSVLRISLDHCLVSPELSVISFKRGPETGSDHFPTITEVSLP